LTGWRFALRKSRRRPGQRPTEPFPTQAQGGTVAEPAGVDRAAPHLGGVRPDAAAARQPVHDRGTGGVADRRRRRAGPSFCFLTLGEIAARAGICVTTARNALRTAAREGLLTIEERRRDKRPNLANVVRVVSREWKTWIERGPKGKAQSRPGAARGEGAKKQGPRIKILSESYAETAFHAVNFPKMSAARRQTASCGGHRLYAASPRRDFSMKVRRRGSVKRTAGRRLEPISRPEISLSGGS